MKLSRFLLALMLLCMPVALVAQETAEVATEQPAEGKKKMKKNEVLNDKGEIIKTGYNYGPLPAVAFDADKGFQLGALLNIFDFGDGSEYPNPRQKWYFEASFFTK